MLKTTGAKSGATRHAVHGHLEESPSSWLVIASLAGSSRNPAWLHNVANRPEATAEFDGGRRIGVRAESLDSDELVVAWDRIGREAPEYVKYLSQTSRDIPVIRLRQRTQPPTASCGSAPASHGRSSSARSSRCRALSSD
jgi:deazaflavin-dependent oxidoreductase (nitroreductase family)